MSRRRALWAAGFGILIAAAWVHVSSLLADPKVPLLVPESGARWILLDRPFRLDAQRPVRSPASFRTRILVGRPPSRALLTVRAFRAAAVFVDGRLVLGPNRSLDAWKGSRHVDLAPFLGPGTHEIAFRVMNENGPAALLAHCETLGLRTGDGWEASADGKSWEPAVPADAPRRPSFYTWFPTSLESVRDLLPLLGPLFVIVFFVTLGWPRIRSRFPRPAAQASAPGTIRWVLLGAFALLAANDFLKLPTNVGFDQNGHLKYIRFVAENWGIPLATEGWQMFQPPLYYLVSAPLYAIFSRFFDLETTIRILRVVPLCCGAAHIQVTYLVSKRIFPRRMDLQGLATLLGGLLPMNLYLSQALGNEPMAGVLSSAVILATFSLDAPGRLRKPTRPLLGLGALLGLALLAKVTVLLLVPLVLLYTAHALRAAGHPGRQVAEGLTAILVAALIVAGWYYVRNWIDLGRPFVGGWEAGRGIVWWQEPAYRTPWQFVAFGSSLVRPIYAGTDRFWDAFYSTLWSDGYLSGFITFESRPPWNDGFLVAGPLLASLPAAGILAGAAGALRRGGQTDRRRLLFAAGALGVYLAAMLRLFLVLPIYSTVKATYTIGILPCYAALGAAGLGLLLRGPLLRAAGYGLLACWGVCSYLAFFVR